MLVSLLLKQKFALILFYKPNISPYTKILLVNRDRSFSENINTNQLRLNLLKIHLIVAQCANIFI